MTTFGPQNPEKMGWIPLAPIRRILLAWEAVQGDDHVGYPYHGTSKVVLPLPPLLRLAHYTGINEDTLRSIGSRKNKQWVDFDIADKIIGVINPQLWRSDPELSAIYESFDFSHLDERRPTVAVAA